MIDDTAIDKLIADLAAVQPERNDVFNQYFINEDANNAIRRANFRLYLQAMAQRQPTTLLVMEAPGYRGSRLTGVPVTSRKVLLEGVADLGMFGQENGFQDVTDAGFENVYGEQSATIVWTTLATLQSVPLIWNTFPFHPCKADNPRTNRRPRKPETQLGGKFLSIIIDLFQPEQIIAIGNVAHETLTGMGIHCDKVRHPAQGGKNDFVAGLTKLLG
ncbi:MAG: uracil-DNA glycosylase [Anaerolineae bacterium]|nr:uracil-DNA glycosylase [Anaerolineae bacterium]